MAFQFGYQRISLRSSLRIPSGEEDPAEQEAWLQSPGSLSQTQGPLTAAPGAPCTSQCPLCPVETMIASPVTSGLLGNEIKECTEPQGTEESHPEATPCCSEDLSSVPSTWGYNPSSRLIHSYINK